jgi:predicted CopG family antitoxin
VKTATVRIPEDRRDVLKVIATIEKREMKDILSDLVDDYIERHRETLDLLSNPDWVKKIEQGKREVLQNIKGKSLNELED